MTIRTRAAVSGAAAVLAFGLAACGTTSTTARRATAAGAHSDSGIDIAATPPTRAPACPAEYPFSRQSRANQPNTA